MRLSLLAISIVLIGAVTVYAQLTPEQEELLKEYQKNQARIPLDAEVSSFSTPELYDSANTAPPQTESTAPEKDEGSDIFGFDIFGESSMKFTTDMMGMPPADYTLGPGDHVLIYIWGRINQELELTVDREGKVYIPKVGGVMALGNTMEQFEHRLRSNLDQYYSDYQLSVSLGKLRQIRIYVLGEVKKPGGYTVSSLSTLLHGLYVADGITYNGSLRNIRLIRQNGDTFEYDLYDLLLKGDTRGDLKLLSGDVIFVPVSGPMVSIEGEVKRPAIYQLHGSEKIEDLIEIAGGLTPTAYLQSVTIDRIAEEDGRILMNICLEGNPHPKDGEVMLQDGDKVRIPSIYESYENKVQIKGHVKHPGTFALQDSMRISDLINDGEQLRDRTYYQRADLFRTHDDGTMTVLSINLEKALAGDSTENILLKPFDNLEVFSYNQIMRKKEVRIDGAVKHPGDYMLFNDMRLSDLIFLAGNPSKSAYMLRAEIARFKPGKPSDIVYINLEDILINEDADSDILLKEDDHVFIRKIPNWSPTRLVQIDGEVYFPGKYALNRENETLAELIERAGGLMPDAFPKGAIFMRKSIANDVARRNIDQVVENTSETRYDSTGMLIPEVKTDFDLNRLNRIIIDLPALLANPGGPDDILLRDGDYVFIPPTPSGVQVIGAVAANGTIAYTKKKRVKSYVEDAGGMAPNAAKSELRLVKADGKVVYGRSAMGKYADLGDAIVVPAKLKKDRDWGNILTTSATILSSVATTVFIIERLSN
ncbi:MAG: hypothetical protein GF315_03745 [candidate division Zixibacteria bacterium]|nr:hypothetical protein [candidate division Zixibacteria bacterium]